MGCGHREGTPETQRRPPSTGRFHPTADSSLTRGNNSVCEIATGNRVAALPDDPMLYIRAAAFSPDGRYLAIAVPDGVIQIWEVATWTKRNEFKGYRDHSITLTFGPGGQLFSGHDDTTVLAWDMRPPRVADSVIPRKRVERPGDKGSWRIVQIRGAGSWRRRRTRSSSSPRGSNPWRRLIPSGCSACLPISTATNSLFAKRRRKHSPDWMNKQYLTSKTL